MAAASGHSNSKSDEPNMLVIGIAGGVASGKSLVGKQLQQLGAVRLDADEAGHRVLQEPEVQQSIRNHWGNSVFDEQGQVSRPAVAQIVFGSDSESRQHLAYLERLTHPRIEDRLREQINRLADRGDVPVVVLDAAVMFKAGWDQLCDRILFVEAPAARRLERALDRGWTAAQFAAREAAQESLDWKRSRADTVIDNTGTEEETFAQVRQFWQSLNPGHAARCEVAVGTTDVADQGTHSHMD